MIGFVPLVPPKESDPTYAAVKKVADEYKVPEWLWYSIAMTESTMNPLAHARNAKEDSRGIFQVNIKAHPDANSTKLFDPEYNARYQMPTIKASYDEAVKKGLKGIDAVLYVERYGQRPVWTQGIIDKLKRYYDDFTKGKSSYNPMFKPDGDPKAIVGQAQDKYAADTGFSGLSMMQSILLIGFEAGVFILLLFSLYIVFGGSPEKAVEKTAGMAVNVLAPELKAAAKAAGGGK